MLDVLTQDPTTNTVGIDQGLSSLTGKTDYVCARGCPFVLRSEAAIKRHEILFHLEERRHDMREKRKEKGKNQEAAESTQVCNYKVDGNVCGYKASSLHYLRKHKQEAGHVNKRRA